MSKIDHFMYGVSDLEAGMTWAADVFGVRPAHGGSHVGLGTRNALLSLGEVYLEIIAPDPAQPLEGNMGGRLSELSEGGLVTWAASADLPGVKAALGDRGVACSGPVRTERRTQDDELLVWELLFPTGHTHGGRMPFFIDWLACTHPCVSNPSGGRFEEMAISVPDAEHLAGLLSAADLTVPVVSGEPSLSVRVATDRGTVELKSTEATSIGVL